MESSKISVKKVEEIWPATEDFPTKKKPESKTLRDELLGARARIEEAKALLQKSGKDQSDVDRDLLRRLDEMLAEIDKLLEGLPTVTKEGPSVTF